MAALMPEDAWRQDPAIPAFSGRSHDALVTEFQKLDRQRLELAMIAYDAPMLSG